MHLASRGCTPYASGLAATLIGTGGTLLSAKVTGKSATENLQTSIGAENKRANLAEKRRIYAQALAALDTYFISGAWQHRRDEPIAVAMHCA